MHVDDPVACSDSTRTDLCSGLRLQGLCHKQKLQISCKIHPNCALRGFIAPDTAPANAMHTLDAAMAKVWKGGLKRQSSQGKSTPYT